jgi:glycine betaine/proline transport system substrate-binding protein
MRKFISPVALALAIFIPASCSSLNNPSFFGGSQPGSGVSVRMGQATWDTGWFQAQIFKLMLEELGYEVRDPETLNNVAFYIFTAQGDLDFWANGWFPIHNRYIEISEVAGEVKPVGHLLKEGALQGYMIDKKTADEFGITNLVDLQNPDIAKLFDQDGDDMADLIGCNEEWGCEVVIEHHLDIFDLRQTVFQVQDEYNELIDKTITRYKEGHPVLFYTWTPNWTVSELKIGQDVMWLSVPFSSLPDEPGVDTQLENMAGCLETPCNLGYQFSDIRVVANSEFLADNPDAAKLFEVVEIPLEDIAAQNRKMRLGENSADDIRRHAMEWIDSNRELVDQWLSAARSAAR